MTQSPRDSETVQAHHDRERLRAEMADALDEELEMELDDERLTQLVPQADGQSRPMVDRSV